MKKKMFFIAGETSGDLLGAWYMQKMRTQEGDAFEVVAIGGDALRQAGAEIYMPHDKLTVVGVLEVVVHIPRLIMIGMDIVRHIGNGGYDEVVLIDFPGFNMRIAREIRNRYPSLNITYLSPPQMWVWGAWRVRSLRRYVDRLIVLYPFEVDWYAQRGLHAEFLGNPVVQRIAKVKQRTGESCDTKITKSIMLLPGSRRQEITALSPYFIAAIQRLSEVQTIDTVYVSVAKGLKAEVVAKVYAEHAFLPLRATVKYITCDDEKYRLLQKSVCVLTKPGTNTLELALLGVPAVVIYKTSWLTYALARCVVSVDSMTLPNLLLRRKLFPEYIQGECTPDRIALALIALYDLYEKDRSVYQKRCKEMAQLSLLLDP